MKYRYIFLLVICSFLQINNGKAQRGGYDLKNVMTPSPNASSLGQYGNTPVGYYSGTHQTNIPLIELKSGDISLPVSLSYNPGGIKVAEYASWTGLGWSLNAGGVITRVTFGNPDTYLNPQVIPANPTDNQLRQAVLGNTDYQPDTYYYNFNGKQGRFYITGTGDVTIVPHQNFKIELQKQEAVFVGDLFGGSPNQVTQFKITTDEGDVYEFHDYEVSKSSVFDPNDSDQDPEFPAHGSSSGGVSAWYLTKITSSTGNIMTFEYSTYNLEYDMPSSEQRYVLTNIYAAIDHPELVKNRMVNMARYFTSNKRLSRIVSPLLTLEFKSDVNRCDLIGDRMLNAVQVKNPAGVVLKSFRLNYGYNGSPTASTSCPLENNILRYTTPSSPTKSRRLYLMSFEALSSAGMTESKTSFAYDYQLPARDSKKRDYWGHFNNSSVDENTFLNYQLAGTSLTNTSNYLILDKDPNLTAATQGTLKRIDYPTGGYSVFEYELNRAFIGNNQFPSEVIPQFHEMVINYQFYNQLPYEYTLTGVLRNYSKDFTVSPNQSNVRILLRDFPYQQIDFSSMRVDIYNKANNSLFVDMIEIDSDAQRTVNPINGSITYTYTKSFPPGEYRMVFKPLGGFIGNGNYHSTYGANPYCRVDGWNNIITHPPTGNFERAIGGLRVKAIWDYEGSGSVRRRDFEYKLLDSEASSGTILSGVETIFDYQEVIAKTFTNGAGGSFIAPVEFNYKVINSETNYPLSTTQGSFVGYSAVTVIDRDVTHNSIRGKTVYTYTGPVGFPDYYGDRAGPNNIFPYPPADSRDWLRGHLLVQRDYMYQNNEYTLIRKQENVYSSPRYLNTIPGLAVRYLRRVLPFENVAQPIYKYQHYSMRAGYLDLLRTITEAIDSAGAVKTEVSYEYNTQPVYHKPIAIHQLNSNGRRYSTYYKYSADFTGATANNSQTLGIAHLLNKNISAREIEKSEYISNTDGTESRLTASTFISYKSNQPLPDMVYNMELNQPITGFTRSSLVSGGVTKDSRYKLALTYNSYDSYGNPQQITPSDGPPVTYIWAYRGQYPVAEVQNATFSAVQTALGGAAALNNFRANLPANDQVARTFLSPLRTHSSLQQSMTKSWTYSPLVGPTSETDASGRTVYYEYDVFGRLQTVKDTESKTVEGYRYHYRNQ